MKRFYKQASVAEFGGAFQIQLDGRELKTPSREALALPTRALADAITAEWNAAGDTIDMHAMPLTKFAFTAVDVVRKNRARVANEILGFGHTDLLSYRADAPPALIARQAANWDPFLNWAAEQYGARLAVVSGITYADQTAEAMAGLQKAIDAHNDFALAALHTATSITGSLVLALALSAGRADATEIFAAATLDELFQAEKWGRDAEAEQRLANHAKELAAAARFLALLA